MKWIIAIFIVIIIGVGSYFLVNSNVDKKESDINIEAMEYYEKGKELHTQKDYQGALELFKKSLDLEENEEVRKAYNKVLSALGPM